MRKDATCSLSAIAAGLLLSGCAAFAPAYTPPAPNVPASFAGTNDLLVPQQVDGSQWWRHFGDPVLDELVRRALDQNRELRAGLARVEAARARLGSARQGYAPGGDVAVQHARQKRSDFGGAGIGSIARSGFDASWELDLFGKVAGAVQGAQARLGSIEATADDLRVTVAADVAALYFELRGAQRRIRLQQAFVEEQRQIVALTAVRAGVGGAAPEDLSRARAQLAGDRAALAAAQRQQRVLLHALAVLLGETPGQWPGPPQGTLSTMEMRPIAIGDPEFLIRSRPDVRRAERLLAAAVADTGVATASLFPQVKVSGFLGYAAGELDDLGDSGSGTWLLAPTISWPVFDLGRVRANIRAREHEANAALAEYEQTVLRALADAEDAFTGYERAQQRLAALAEQAMHARTAADVARARYEEGETDYRAALDAVRDARLAESALVDGLVQQRLATIAVRKALGVAPPDGVG